MSSKNHDFLAVNAFPLIHVRQLALLNQTRMALPNNQEEFELSFLGMKLKCKAPSYRTLVIILLCMAFFLAMVSLPQIRM